DNTAFGFVFPYFNRKGQPKFFLYQHSFIPWNHSGSIENKERQDGIDYRTLEKMGFCTITEASIDSYLSLKNVEESITPKFDMHNREVYIGFDYSQFSDNTAFGFVFPYFNRKGQPKFFLYQHSFIPWNHSGSIENKERQDGIDYRTLEKMGFCTITEHKDGIINTDQVYQW
ncbi:terminase TerL endonuclease subunit, partial [Oenococcus oeni]|uniref:terminase TerL endonuclease subunit n=1 Tax=Oenococcus oeni TaxID=1247 RepID=UPI00214B9400